MPPNLVFGALSPLNPQVQAARRAYVVGRLKAMGIHSLKQLSLVGRGPRDPQYGSDWRYQGYYDRRTDHLTVYANAFQDAATVNGIIAHEGTHKKFETVRREYRKEQQLVRHYFGERELVGAERVRFPIYHLLHRFMDGDRADQVTAAGGFNSFTRAQWRKFHAGTMSGGRTGAINETLAEIARFHPARLAPVWREFYQAFDEAYRLAESRKPHGIAA